MPKDLPPPPPDPFYAFLGDAIGLRKPENKPLSWPWVLLSVLSALVFGAVFWAKMVFANQRAAKLASDLRKTREAQKQAQGDARMEANEKTRSKLALQSKRQKLKAEHLERKVAARIEQRKQYAEQLKKVATWNDIVVNDKRGEDD